MPTDTIPQTILTLETSHTECSLCLWHQGSILITKNWLTERNKQATIFAILEEISPLLSLHPPTLILVGSGPGSYSGVRVALAAADGMSLIYQCPVISTPSWEAFLPAQEAPIFIISNARRGSWALAQLKQGKLLPLSLMTTEELIQELSIAQQKNISIITSETEDTIAPFSDFTINCNCIPTALKLLQTWLHKSLKEQEIYRNQIPEPYYVRPPHITPAKNPLWGKKEKKSFY